MTSRLVALSTSVAALAACGTSPNQEAKDESSNSSVASSSATNDLIAAINAGETGKHACIDPQSLSGSETASELSLLEKIESESTITIDDGLGGYIVLCTTSCPKNAPKLCKVQKPT